MNLTITQDNTRTETINSSIIDKLYEIAFAASSDSNSTVSLTGRLESPKGYKYKIDWLNTEFSPDLTITVPDSGWYLQFSDSVLESIIFPIVSSDGIGISTADCEAITSFNTLNLANNESKITSFDELKYFTNITSLPQGCLAGLSQITLINLKNISSIGNTVFDGKTSLSNVGDCSNLRTIGVFAFKSTTSLLLMDLTGITTLNLEAFRNSGIREVNCPSLLTLGQAAFLLSDVRTVTKLGNIIIPQGYCFNGCASLNSVNLPDSLTTISEGMFASCTSLTSITLPSTCTSIGWSAFAGCTSLSSITGMSNLTSIGANAFKNCHLSGALYLPSAVSIGSNAFYNTGITKVKNLGSITELQGGVFLSCSNLTEVNIPTTVTILNSGVFTSCPNLRKITGFDNIISVSKNNYQIYNITITNPVGFKNFTLFPNISGLLKSSIFYVFGQEVDMNIYSLFYPKLLSTVQCSESWYGSPKNSFFLYMSIGNKRLTTGLLYFKDITSFGTGTFFAVNITNLVINNTTPPTLNNSDTTYNTESWWASWGEYIFGNGDPRCTIGTLWVPDSAVATYQADPLYSSLTIKGINTKTNGVDYDLPRYANFAAWEAAEEAAVAQGGHAPYGLIEDWM